MKSSPTNMFKDDVKKIVDDLGSDAYRFSGKTVLLSGGAGFLGRHFISVLRRLNKEVLEKPCKVISADNYIRPTITLQANSWHYTTVIIMTPMLSMSGPTSHTHCRCVKICTS
jgi:hypothetical protein